LCNTDQRLSPEVWQTERLSKFPAVGLLLGSPDHTTPCILLRNNDLQEEQQQPKNATESGDQHSCDNKTAPKNIQCPFAFLEEASSLHISTLHFS